jgi:hypothetical protein
MSVAGSVVTVTYSEPVCRTTAFLASDWQVSNVSANTTDVLTGDNTPVCDATASNAVTTANLFLTSPMPPGAFVEVDLLESGAAGQNQHIRDVTGNTIKAPQGQTASATSVPSTAPTITSATGAVGSSTVTVNFSQAVYCTAMLATHWTLNDNNTSTVDPVFDVTPSTDANACGGSAQTADSSFSLHTTTALPTNTTYTLTFTPTASNEIRNVYGVSLVNPPGTAATTFTTGAADFTPPTLIDARMVNNAGPSTDFTESGDSFSVTFSEKMNGGGSLGPPAQPATISIQDQDGTTATIGCAGGTPNTGTATCSWDAAFITVTVTLTSTLTPTSGTTPGMQIPFNITSLTGVTDSAGNPPNVLGSSDRLVDYE